MALVDLRSNAVETTPDAAFSCHGRAFGALYAIWEDEGDDAANSLWLRTEIDRVAPVCIGAYVSEVDLERPDRALRTLSLEAQARLAELRAVHDPKGVLNRAAGPRAVAAE